MHFEMKWKRTFLDGYLDYIFFFTVIELTQFYWKQLIHGEY